MRGRGGGPGAAGPGVEGAGREGVEALSRGGGGGSGSRRVEGVVGAPQVRVGRRGEVVHVSGQARRPERVLERRVLLTLDTRAPLCEEHPDPRLAVTRRHHPPRLPGGGGRAGGIDDTVNSLPFPSGPVTFPVPKTAVMVVSKVVDRGQSRVVSSRTCY